MLSFIVDFEVSESLVTFSSQVDTACFNLTAFVDSRVENNEAISISLTSTDPAVQMLTDILLVVIVDQSTGKLITMDLDHQYHRRALS